MIIVYENQAELPSRDVNCNDYPLRFPGNFQENRVYNVH